MKFLPTMRALSVIFWLLAMARVHAIEPWVSTVRSGEIAFFTDSAETKIERYDLTGRSWLSPIALPSIHGPVTKTLIAGDTIYAAFGTAVYAYQLDGSDERFLLDAPYPVRALHVDGNLLLVHHVYGILSVNRVSGTQLGFYDNSLPGTSYNPLLTSVLVPSAHRLIGTTHYIPWDIQYVSYDENGRFLGEKDSPYHGDFPEAANVWLFPDGTRVIGDAGTIYETGGLSYLAVLEGGITDVDFYGHEIPVILRGRNLTAYSPGLVQTGTITLPFNPGKIFISGADVVAFFPDPSTPHGIAVETVPLASLNAPSPRAEMEPEGLPYLPDTMFVDNQGVLNLVSRAHQRIFQWDPARQKYIASIPLPGAPDFVAYQPTSNAIFESYPDGSIRKTVVSSGSVEDRIFTTLPEPAIGLAAAGPYLFAARGAGVYRTYHTIDGTGRIVGTMANEAPSREFVWNSANQLLYHFRDNTSPNDLVAHPINADGTVHISLGAGGIGRSIDSSAHSSDGITYPIRVSPDGNLALIGSGLLHMGKTLVRLSAALSNGITDAAWRGHDLVTIRQVDGNADIQTWLAPDYQLSNTSRLGGKPLRILSLPTGGYVCIVRPASGIPAFHLLSADFTPQPSADPAVELPKIPAPFPTPLPILLTADVSTGFAVRSEFGDPIGVGQNYLITSPTYAFQAQGNPNSILAYFSGYGPSWYFEFSAPPGFFLYPGLYLGATQSLSRSGEEPRIDITERDHSQRSARGQFEIKELTWNEWRVASFWVTFKQYSGSSTAPLIGEFRFNAHVPPGLQPAVFPTPQPSATPTPFPTPQPPVKPSDFKKPTIEIFGGATRQTDRATFLVAGRVSDNKRVVSLEIRRRGDRYRPLAENKYWSTLVKLNPGRNVFEIRAMDDDGNQSRQRIIITSSPAR